MQKRLQLTELNQQQQIQTEGTGQNHQWQTLNGGSASGHSEGIWSIFGSISGLVRPPLYMDTKIIDPYAFFLCLQMRYTVLKKLAQSMISIMVTPIPVVTYTSKVFLKNLSFWGLQSASFNSCYFLEFYPFTSIINYMIYLPLLPQSAQEINSSGWPLRTFTSFRQ